MTDLNREDAMQPAAKKKGLYIRTFGCQMNEYDSDKIVKLLESDYQRVDAPEKASLVIVNTCSVREKPEHKLYSLLGTLNELKEGRPDLMIGVGGCVAQQEGQNIVKRSSAVDFVFGTHNLSLVPSLVQLRQRGSSPQVAVDYRDEWEELPPGFANDGKVTRFVSISRGCNKNCTYCIVPTTRGKEVSRDIREVEREVRVAVHGGAREVTLLGQTVNSYGLDLTPRVKFSELLTRLSAIEGLERIRFTSPHPQEIRDDFFELFASNAKICRHVHLPLQAGSDRVLRLMNRNYRRDRYLSIVQSLRDAVPDVALTTDIIVGFPGETEADFEDTMALVESVRFENCFSFIFSPRPGTEAATLADPVSYEQKLARLLRLQARQTEITEEKYASRVGSCAEVLLEGPSPFAPDSMQGKTSQNLLTIVEDPSHTLKPGEIVRCEIVGSGRLTLKARIQAGTGSFPRHVVQAGI